MNTEADFATFWPEYVRAHSQAGTPAVHLAGTLTADGMGAAGCGRDAVALVADCACACGSVRAGVDFSLFCGVQPARHI